MVTRTGSVAFFLRKNRGVAAIELAASNNPLDCCILWFDFRTYRMKKLRYKSTGVFFVVTRTGISHGLKTCRRHVFLTAFRFPHKLL